MIKAVESERKKPMEKIIERPAICPDIQRSLKCGQDYTDCRGRAVTSMRDWDNRMSYKKVNQNLLTHCGM